MDTSPLAAMQRSPPLPLPFGRNMQLSPTPPSTFGTFGPIGDVTPRSFNFAEIMEPKTRQDYFNSKIIRGSSPAALAADLSQNFHIDNNSPQLPTPRRNLFSINVPFGQGHVLPSSPPIPSSSSDVPTSDSMDISPLPHKLPPRSSLQVELQSPTPDVTPVESFRSEASPLPPPVFQFPSPIPQHERRKSAPRRPSLTRAKTLSTNATPIPCAPESQSRPFRFGNDFGTPKTAIPVLADLSEAFEKSPEQMDPPARATGMMLPPPRRPFGRLSNCGQNGSPGGHLRKNSNPMIRPRKQFRRALSMFEKPKDIVNQQSAGPLAPIMDDEPPHVLQLPHFMNADECNGLPRINAETMVDVLAGKFDHFYAKRTVIDCRFEYEYQGGHVVTAVNFNDKEKMATQLFDFEPTPKALIIFHCEYSVHRAPIMAKYIRQRDRQVNVEQYPKLTYPEMYIMDGGYSSFFKSFASKCYPQNYVEMAAQEHAQACEKGLGKVKQRSKNMRRAQTFTFGDSPPLPHNSPTAMDSIRDSSLMDVDDSSPLNKAPWTSKFRSTLEFDQPRTRRMISF